MKSKTKHSTKDVDGWDFLWSAFKKVLERNNVKGDVQGIADQLMNEVTCRCELV